MQKSKVATIVIIIVILMYSLITMKYMYNEPIYTYIINPIFWIVLAIVLKFLIPTLYKKSLKKEIIQYTITASLVYVLIYLVSGLFVTFGKNPYSRAIEGVMTNLWIFGSIIIAKEYIRYKLINNVYEKDKVKIGVILIFVYTFIESGIGFFFLGEDITGYYIFKRITTIVLPIIAKNILYTYTALNSGYLAAMIYEFSTKLFLWISPILPNAPWVMSATIDITVPVILFLYIRYIKNKKDIYKNRKDLIYIDPKAILPTFIVVILAIWFAIGVFPIKPVAIATGSMIPTINIGDIAIIQKCKPHEIEIGDIIEYSTDNLNVTHRVVDIKDLGSGRVGFVTKGDNNEQKDREIIQQSQLVGKVLFKIRFLGYPAVWLSIAKTY